MRQARADDHERRPRLRQLVARRAERRDVVGAEVLHLVDEDGDAALHVRGQRRDLGEQLDEVDLDVAGVGAAGADGDVDAGLPAVAQLRALGRRAQGERLEDAQHLVDAVGLGVAHGEVADRAVQRGGERAAEVGLRPRLDLARPPARADGHRAQLAEQHRLADAAQPGEHEAALGATAGHALEHDLERVELAVAACELGRSLPGAGGEGVAHGIHDRTVSGNLATDRRSG